MDADGRNPRRLTFAPGDDGWPRWAPHGRAITFESDRDAGAFVFNDEVAAYVVNLDSGQARRVSPLAIYPDWRQDGRIVFQESDEYDLVSVRPYGGGRAVEARDVPADRWAVRASDDGTMIVYTRGDPAQRLYTARSDGTGAKLAYRTRGANDIVNPVWSPDGEWITFSMGPEDRYDVYVVRTDGSGLTRLTRMAPRRLACCSDWGP